MLASGRLIPPAAALRLEPAELLPNHETRAHWQDVTGWRYAHKRRAGAWSADGLLLRLTLVDAPPPSHRGWLEAVLRGDEAAEIGE